MKNSRTQLILIFVVIVVAAIAIAVFWSGQNEEPEEDYSFHGNTETSNNHFRLWTNVDANAWSGLKTSQSWSFEANPSLKAQVKVTSLVSPTFYTEVILVNDGEIDEGFGFQLTYAAIDKVRIAGWSWDETSDSLTDHIDKDINIAINLEARKISANQIDFYVDDTVLGSVTTNIPYQTGIMNIDMTNGSEGGITEITISFEIDEKT